MLVNVLFSSLCATLLVSVDAHQPPNHQLTLPLAYSGRASFSATANLPTRPKFRLPSAD